MWILPYITFFILAALTLWCIATLVALVWYVPRLATSFIETPRLLIPHRRSNDFPGDSCVFFNSDGGRVHGTFWQSELAVPLGSVVLCHELNGDRACVSEVARWLVEAGFDALAFDFRNHGESDKNADYANLPWLTTRDIDDVLSAVDFLQNELSPGAPIGVYGVSRGASAAICAASRDCRIRGVVADGAFPIYDMMLPYVRRRMRLGSSLGWAWEKLPDFWVLLYCRAAVRLAGRRLGCQFIDTRMRARSVRQPVLLIRGESDSFVSAGITNNLHRGIRGTTSVWEVSGAKHNAAVSAQPVAYRQRVCRFFESCCSRWRPPTFTSATSASTSSGEPQANVH